MSTIEDFNQRINSTVFTCSCCNSTLDYVQLINEHNSVEKDYFACDTCGATIEGLGVKEEEVPAFFD